MAVAEDSWRRLRRLRANPPSLAGAEVDEARTRVFQAAMTQAEELWGAASAVGAASRPLPLFYCLSQAGRAICAAWTRDGDWRPGRHGITSRFPDQSDSVPAYGVRVPGPVGMYPAVAAATDSTTFDGVATVAELWASLPDLPRPEGFGDDAPLPIHLEAVRVGDGLESPQALFARVLAPKHARIVSYPLPPAVYQALEGALQDEARLGEVADSLDGYPTTRGVVPELHTLSGVFGDERAVVLTFPDEGGELRSLSSVGDSPPRRTDLGGAGRSSRYAIRPRIGTGDDVPPSQLMTLWALMYAFSQLARYEPEVWVAALDPDQSAVAVDLEHVLDTALELVPELLVPAATSGLMPRLLRERMEEERSTTAGPASDTAAAADGPPADESA